MSGSRFEINPGPLRLRGEIPKEDFNASRCEAITRDGLRCLRDGGNELNGRRLCKQHARAGRIEDTNGPQTQADAE